MRTTRFNRLRFNEIPADGLIVDLSKTELGILEKNVSFVSMKAHVCRVREGCSVIGSIGFKIWLLCSFCTRKFEHQLSESFNEILPLDKVTEESHDAESFVDLTVLANEIINLSIPIQVSCEKHCKGLCSGCGVNLNIEKCSCKKMDIETPFSVLKGIDI